MELLNYLLKVSACTVMFFAFYVVVLRKLTFFKFNRFYLLITLLISFIIPTLHFTFEREVAMAEVTNTPIVLPTTAVADEAFEVPIQVMATPVLEEGFDYYALLPYLYFCIVAGLLIFSIQRLFQLAKHIKSSGEKINGLKIVAKAKGFTNCSFFNYVFIDQESLSQEELAILLKHEEVHAKQLHSLDKLMMMVIKAVLWFNPVVYLYDRALEQAHEYEADEATSKNCGTSEYAGLLLRLAISKSEMPLVHNFVKSPIKERIKMLFNSKSKHMKKLMYLLALPIGLGLLWGFTVDIIEVSPSLKNDGNTFTLVLDAGHGGKNIGGQVNNVTEKNLTIAIAKKIKTIAEAKGLNVILTRNSDEYVAQIERAKVKGNILLSLHVNSAPSKLQNGVEMFTSRAIGDQDMKLEKSNVLTNHLYKSLKNISGIKINDKPRIMQHLVILDKADMPGVVLELGYLTNKNDFQFITNETNQDELAKGIVNGILSYKEKTPTDEELELRRRKRYPQGKDNTPANNKNDTKLNHQNKPFVQRTKLKTADGYSSEQITLNTINGKPVSTKVIFSGTAQSIKIWLFIDGKLYSEEEALKFDKNLISRLSEKRGYGMSGDFDLPETNNEKYAYVFWFGNEPKLSAATAKNRAYYQKYNGTTVEGKILGYTYSPVSKVMDGFLVKTNSGETLKANVEAKFATQTQAMISKNDNVSIKIYNANYWKDSNYPVLTSYKISKNGKLLYDRWPKMVSNKTSVVNETIHIDQKELTKIPIKPVLISSSTMSVDTKNNVTYITKGLMEIGDAKLQAEDMTWDHNNEIITAKNATLTSKNGDKIVSKSIVYDLKKGAYSAIAVAGTIRAKSSYTSPYVVNKSSDVEKPTISAAYTLLSKLKIANDSLRIRTMFDKTLMISGNVKLRVDGYGLTGRVLQVDKDSNLITAHLATFTDKDGIKVSGDVIEFDLISKNYKVTKPVGSAYMYMKN